MMRKRIRKYLAIMELSFKNSVQYRLELLLWSFIDATPMLAMLVLWLSAFDGNDLIAGYTQASLIAYYISGYVFQDLTGSHFEEHMTKEVLSGNVSSSLIRPFSLRRFLVVEQLSWRVMTALIIVSPVVMGAIVFAKDIMPAITFTHILILPIMLAMAYILESIYSLFVVAMAFVFEEARGFMHLKWMLGWLFSGSMIPFEFMPVWLHKIADFLPFQYRYYVPIQIYFGNVVGVEIWYSLIKQLMWLIIGLFFMRKLWDRNLKKFTAVGN